nr:hypothetical protein [Tanacetum cinerariifolium]
MLKKEDSNSVPEPDEYEFWEDGVEERRIVIQLGKEKKGSLKLRFGGLGRALAERESTYAPFVPQVLARQYVG